MEDPRLRLDIGKLTDVVANNRKVAWGILYGSEPPPIDSVWQKIRERGWKVIITQRSTFTGKEKQVDHQMVADITVLVSGCIVKDVILIFSNAKARDEKDFEKHHFEKIFRDLNRKYPGKISNYPAYRRHFDRQEEISLSNKFEPLQSLEEQTSKESLTGDDLLSSYEAIEDLDEDDEKEQFQVVRSKQQKKTQKYSTLCIRRSKCKKGLKCQYHHTDDEKKFFGNFCKNKECTYKGACRYGPSKCFYAHSDKDSFCCTCHSWEHLEKNCPTPQMT